MSFAHRLLHASRSVHEYLEDCAPGAPRESRSILAGLRESCLTLGDLVIDPELASFLRSRVGPLSIDDAQRVLAAYQENRQAMTDFLAAERELFIRAGLPVSATEHLLDKLRDVIKEPRAYEAGEMVEGLAQLKSYVCERVDRTQVSRNRAILGGLRDLLSGLTIATLNGGLLAATVGITGAAAAASVTAGGLVAADGYTTVRKLF
jgi:hypothetical protein